MAVNVGVGLDTSPHPSVANLWVREVDPTQTIYKDAVVTGVVQTDTPGVAGKFLQANTYVHGCVLTKVDGASSASAQYTNVGTLASPSWKRWSV